MPTRGFATELIVIPTRRRSQLKGIEGQSQQCHTAVTDITVTPSTHNGCGNNSISAWTCLRCIICLFSSRQAPSYSAVVENG